MIKALWKYKGFIFGMVWREFKVQYLGSVLGCLQSDQKRYESY